jgi:hypothetical protein
LAGKNYKPAPLKGISQYEAASFLETDFFTYSLAHFLGPDLLRHLTAFFPARDRASALEHAMECSDYSPQIGAYFSQPLENLFTSDYHLPIWFINTTNLDTGEPGVVSNVKIKQPWTHRRDILNEVDHDQCSGNPQLMKLSTAAVIGARFPYISPAGTINEEHYVDGGYYDNSGGGITLELMQLIEKKMHDTTSPLHKLLGYVKFKVIYISNGTNKVKKTQLHPLANDLAAPLLTVLGTYSNQTTLGNSRLEDCIMSSELRLPDPYRTLNLPMNTTDTEDYPMNWVLSDYSIKRMERNLDSVNPKEILWGYPTEENSPKVKNKIKLPEKHL